MKKEYVTIFGFWLVFEMIAVVLWQTQHNLFYLFNFSYIGTCLAAGLLLYQHKWKYARNAVQFAVGLYMLVYLGYYPGKICSWRVFGIICFPAYLKRQ